MTDSSCLDATHPIDELDVSIRAYACLENAGIRTLGELVSRSKADLIATRCFGRRTLKEIEAVLEDMGLALRKEVAQ